MKEARTQRPMVPVFAGLMLMALWVGAALWLDSERRLVISVQEKNLSRKTALVEEQTLRLFKLAETSILVTADWVREHPKTFPGQDPSFIKLVENLRRISGGELDIRFVDAAGGLFVVPSKSRQPVANVAVKENIKIQMNPKTRGLYIGDLTISPVDNKWIVPVTYPVVKKGGELVILAVILEFDRTAQSFNLLREEPNGSITIFKSSGVTLFRTPNMEGVIGKSLAGTPEFVGHLSTIEHGQYRSKSPFDGVERIISHARLSDYPLIVAVTASLKDTLAPWLNELYKMISMVLFVTVATILIAHRFHRLENESRMRLAESGRRSRDFSSTASDWFWETDTEHRFSYLSDNFEQVCGLEPGQVLGKNSKKLLAQSALNPPELIEAYYAELEAHKPFKSFEYQIVGNDGSVRWISVSGIPHFKEDGCFAGYRGTGSIITLRKKTEADLKIAHDAEIIKSEQLRKSEKILRESEKHIRVLFNSGNDPILVHEIDSISGAPLGQFIEVNDVACSRLGYTREELLLIRPEDIIAPEAAAHPPPNFKIAYNRKGVYESIFLTSDGQPLPVEINAHVFDLYDKTLVFAMARDITERKKAEADLKIAHAQIALRNAELEQISITDRLTGLYNRRKLDDVLIQEMERVTRYSHDLSVIILDIDKFKSVNDQFGHLTGDIVLIKIAEILLQGVRKTDIVGRWGGEEFLIICPNSNLEGATALAEHLRQSVETYEFDVVGPKTCSFGVAQMAKEEPINFMIARADAALYRAKESGRNRVEVDGE